MSSPKSIREIFSQDEIVLVDLWAIFWNKKKYLFIGILVFGIIGFIEAITTPKEFSASCVLLAEEGGGGTNPAAQALAGLTGSALPSSGGGVTELYPIILANQPFLVELSKDTVYLTDKKPTTLAKYFEKPLKTDAITAFKVNILSFPGSFFGTVKGWFHSSPKEETATKTVPLTISQKPLTGNDTGQEEIQTPEPAGKPLIDPKMLSVVQISGQEIFISSILRKRIQLSQTGREVSITVKTPEAWLSAEAAKLVLNKLIQYVIRYKTGKQLQNLEFLEARAAEANSKYKKDQSLVAGFSDKNYGVIYETVKSKASQLENEYSRSVNIYNQLAGQLEQARIELKKQTPLFTILQPVYVPNGPDPVSTSKIVMTNVAVGAVLGLLAIFARLIFDFIMEGRKRKSTVQ